MITLELYFKTCTKKDGTTFNKEYTAGLGFEVKVVLAKNAHNLKYRGQDGKWYITYDPTKAGLRLSQSGYFELVIGV